MDEPILEFISRYKVFRAEHLQNQHLFRSKKGNGKLTELDLITQDEAFFNRYLLDSQGLAKLRKATISPVRWTSLILAMKNRAEMINAQIDYFNYFHTFLAIALPLFILAGQLNKMNYGLAAACVGFIITIFQKRSNLRIELSTAKELVNVFERLSKETL